MSLEYHHTVLGGIFYPKGEETTAQAFVDASHVPCFIALFGRRCMQLCTKAFWFATIDVASLESKSTEFQTHSQMPIGLVMPGKSRAIPPAITNPFTLRRLPSDNGLIEGRNNSVLLELP